MKNNVVRSFSAKYGYPSELVIKAPGRVNIMGGHTDYNDGYVLPVAIDYGTYFALAKSQESTTRFYSVDGDEHYSVDKDTVEKTDNKWVNRLLGVIKQLSPDIGQFDVVFASTIPQGAGLSDSEALCCGLAFGLSELYNLNLEKWTIAKIAQRSEHEFGEVECGIMNQFASVFGITNHVMQLNCLTLEYTPHEFDITGYRFLLIDSGVSHALEPSEFNLRKQECLSAIKKLKEASNGISSYQDISSQLLQENRRLLTQAEYSRARHVVTENRRVVQMTNFLKTRDFDAVGECLVQSHESLRNDFEVTSQETDYLVYHLKSYEEVFGARQVGSGFGGSVLAIAKDLNLNALVDEIKKNYRKKFHLPLRWIPVRISSGCQVLA